MPVRPPARGHGPRAPFEQIAADAPVIAHPDPEGIMHLPEEMTGSGAFDPGPGIFGQPGLRPTGLVSWPGAQRVKPFQGLGHALDPYLAVVHPGTVLFRRS
jgi:hypothetical protein